MSSIKNNLLCSFHIPQLGPSKGVNPVLPVTCFVHCSRSVACSIVLNLAITFEQKQFVCSGLVMLHAVCRCHKLLLL